MSADIELPDDVRAELGDPEYGNRQHYSRATYALGCRGPLCRAAEKHRGRKRSEQRAKANGRPYVPIPGIRDSERDAELAPIISWHLSQRGGKGFERPVTVAARQ